TERRKNRIIQQAVKHSAGPVSGLTIKPLFGSADAGGQSEAVSMIRAAILSVLCGYLVCCIALFYPGRSPAAGAMTSTLLIGGSRIDVNIEANDLKVSHDDLMHWVRSAGEAVATYYGKYPRPHVTLRIHSFRGRGVRHGQTFGYDGGLIKISVGTE